MTEQQQTTSTPELEHVAALALNALLSNPAVIKDRSQVEEEGLKTLADIAFRAAYFLEQRLHQARTNG